MPRRRDLPAELLEKLIAGHEAGESRRALALKHEINYSAVTTALERAGVTLRDDRRRRGPACPMYRTGRYIDAEGYVRVRVAENDPFIGMTHTARRTVLEHRLVMARQLGRLLTSTERVHHLNGDKTDNRLENLELWETSHPYGQRPGERSHCPTCTCGR